MRIHKFNKVWQLPMSSGQKERDLIKQQLRDTIVRNDESLKADNCSNLFLSCFSGWSTDRLTATPISPCACSVHDQSTDWSTDLLSSAASGLLLYTVIL